MKDGWQEIHRRWSKLKPPQRPHADVIESFRRAVEGRRARVLLLGVTPELADLGEDTTAMDNSENMIVHIWPGDNETRRAVLGNWLDISFGEKRFTAVVGDGCLNTLVYPDYVRLFAQLAKVLAPGARIALRIFETPDACETVAELREQALAGKIESFHAFKWRLAMSMVTEGEHPDLPVTQLHTRFMREFSDRAALSRATGWPLDDIDGIDAYADNSAIYSFPTRAQIAAALPQAFSEMRFVSSGLYELAERCPILIADFRP
jgi:hypothetical protein